MNMTRTNVRGLLLAFLIGALMAAGVILTTPQAKADSQQDYIYFSLLENNGMHITSPSAAKELGLLICRDLIGGRSWRLIVTDIMTGADFDLDSATTVVASAIVAYCPAQSPNGQANSKVA